jgi:dTDP-4-dehydrorhamnose 3,5-epimerase-like enzyme
VGQGSVVGVMRQDSLSLSLFGCLRGDHYEQTQLVCCAGLKSSLSAADDGANESGELKTAGIEKGRLEHGLLRGREKAHLCCAFWDGAC